jgi:very-short-patch-repair endonuclease
LIDLAALVDEEGLEKALHDALRRGLTSIDRLTRRLEVVGGKGRSGTCAVRALLALASKTPELESALEVRMMRLIRKHRLPAPVPQYEISLRGRKMRFDFAYPDSKLAIEVDGYSFHSTTADWRSDRARQNLAVADGWNVLRYGWHDLDEKENEIASTLRDLLLPRLL